MPFDADRPVVGPQRTHPLTVVLGLGGVAIGAIFGLVLSAGLLGSVIALGGALRFVGWFFRTYELRADELVISAGVLTRRVQVVPYQRIQQIDIHRSLLAQLLGLTELRIDTAGSKEGRVQLAYLDHALSQSIRAWVLARRAELAESTTGGRAADGPRPTPEAEFSLSAGRLLLAGATSTGPVVALALYLIAIPVTAPVVLAGGDAVIWVLGGAAIAAIVLLVATAIVAAGHLLTYARFRVSVAAEDLKIDYGLLEVQHLTLPRARVQHVSIIDNPIRRALGLLSITVHSAAIPGAEHETSFTIVALPRARLSELLAFVVPQPHASPLLPELAPRPPAARRRAVVRRSLIIALPAIAVAVAWFPVGVVSLLASSLGVPWGRLAHRRAGHAVTDTIAVVSAGAVAHRVEIVPIARVQSSRTRQSPLQRRVDLASFSLDVAGGAPALYDMDLTIAARLRATIPLAGEITRAR
jgi:putative membrane protein